jgi:hypothetical protein
MVDHYIVIFRGQNTIIENNSYYRYKRCLMLPNFNANFKGNIHLDKSFSAAPFPNDFNIILAWHVEI